VDSIEHGSFLQLSTLQLMKQKGVYLVPTRRAGYGEAAAGDEAGRDRARRELIAGASAAGAPLRHERGSATCALDRRARILRPSRKLERSARMRNETASVLNELIETSKDGEKGFARAAEETTDGQLKSVLSEGASRCRSAAKQLQASVASLGVKPETKGSALGTAHRGWLDLKSAATGRSPKAILEECERGEDYAKARYAEALEHELPPEVRALVEMQYQGVLANHDRVKALRNQYVN
jgi:uncharacterized protein (TIGR02284 family)